MGIKPATFRLDYVSNDEEKKLKAWYERHESLVQRYRNRLDIALHSIPQTGLELIATYDTDRTTTSPSSLCILLYFTGSE